MRELEEKYGDVLVVIGVHSGKFRAERVTANIAKAAQRLGVEHPVVNDRQFRVWRSFGVGAWPTAVLIDPAGGVVGAVPGEFRAADLAPVLDGLIAEFDRPDAPEGARLVRGPAPLRLPPQPAGPLAYPGRVVALSRERLLLADSGHHRILDLRVDEALTSAQVVRVIGAGRAGFADGPPDAAAFRDPQGMVLVRGRFTSTGLALVARVWTLFVADTGNHAVRVVQLPEGEVSTLAGTGRQAQRIAEAGLGHETALSSPWDVELLPAPPDSTLSVPGAAIIAMAGTHQLWRLDLHTRVIAPWAGTGREDISDGPPARCALAQPTGIRRSGRRLYFADSESSAVRFVDLDGRDGPEVQTIVGTGLFEFGDVDGQGGHARLQHPYDLTVHDGLLYVADTYNNKLKAVDPAARTSLTFAGTGEAGLEDGDAGAARFDEPQGIAAADGLLYVADTHNHALRVVDLRAAPPSVRTLEIVG